MHSLPPHFDCAGQEIVWRGRGRKGRTRRTSLAVKNWSFYGLKVVFSFRQHVATYFHFGWLVSGIEFIWMEIVFFCFQRRWHSSSIILLRTPVSVPKIFDSSLCAEPLYQIVSSFQTKLYQIVPSNSFFQVFSKFPFQPYLSTSQSQKSSSISVVTLWICGPDLFCFSRIRSVFLQHVF